MRACVVAWTTVAMAILAAAAFDPVWHGTATFGAVRAAGASGNAPTTSRGAGPAVGAAASAVASAAPDAPAAPPDLCAGDAWVIPEWLVYAESRCRFDVVNVDGCLGHGCVGAYQFDLRHWDPQRWGTCADLGSWTDVQAQHECAARLSNGGTSLAPWGA